MKKIITLVITGSLMMSFHVGRAQVFSSDFENWTGNVPNGWVGTKTNLEADSISPYTTNAHGGTYACELVNTESTHKRFTTGAHSVTNGTTYSISYWVRGSGSIRTGLYDGRATGYGYATYNSYHVVNSTTWAQFSDVITAAYDTTGGEFIFSVQLTSPANDHIQIDDVSIDTASITPIDTSIYDIQYTTAGNGDSPLNNQVVNTSGIVTGTYQYGFFMQDGTGPWNGIYVLDSVHTRALGDNVSLTGTVYEFFNMTEIKNVTAFTVVSSGNTLPVPSAVTAATVNSENVEGVLVKVTDVTCIETNSGYGMWKVQQGSAPADTCKIHDLIYQYTPVLNTHYDITGPVYYSFNEYRIEPRDVNDVQIHTSLGEYALNIISMYPNPVSNFLSVSNIEGTQTIRISNILGESVQNIKVLGNYTTINVSKLSKGVYFISLIDANGVINIRKFIKE